MSMHTEREYRAVVDALEAAQERAEKAERSCEIARNDRDAWLVAYQEKFKQFEQRYLTAEAERDRLAKQVEALRKALDAALAAQEDKPQ